MAHLEHFTGKLQRKERIALPTLLLIKPLIPQLVSARRLLGSPTQSEQKGLCPQPAGRDLPPSWLPAGDERVRNQQSQDQFAAGSSSGEGRRGGELEPATSGCLPAPRQPRWGPRRGQHLLNPHPMGCAGPPATLGASPHRRPHPARHGEPEQRPEEESHGAALQGRGDDCWRAIEVGGDGALLLAVPWGSGLYPSSRRLKALSLSKCFPPRCWCLPPQYLLVLPSPTKPVVNQVLSHLTVSRCSSLGISCPPPPGVGGMAGGFRWQQGFLILLHPPLNPEPDVVTLSSFPRVPGPCLAGDSTASGGVQTSGGDLGGHPMSAMHLNCFAQPRVGSSPS